MSEPLGGDRLIEVAAEYFADDPGTTYSYLYDRIRADHDVVVSRSSFTRGGYATAAKRLAEARANAEPEPVPEPPRPSVPPAEPPPTALTPEQLAWERQEYRRRRREREEAFQAARETEARRRRDAFQLPRRRNGRKHPFARDFAVGRKARGTSSTDELGPAEYLPAIEFVETGVRRR